MRLLKFWHLAHLSQPASDRPLYYAVREAKPRRILELGMGCLERTERIIKLALSYAEGPLEYMVIDPFESMRKTVTLKETYRVLRAICPAVRIIPGAANEALPPIANMLPPVDLVMISKEEFRHTARAWYYLPRILDPACRILVEQEKAWSPLPLEQVHRLADKNAPARRRLAA